MLHGGPAGVGRVAVLWEALGAVGVIGIIPMEGAWRRRGLVGAGGATATSVNLTLLRVGAEAAAAAGGAQAPGRVVAVLAAPVPIVPERVPVELQVILEAPREARVVPPVLLRPVSIGVVFFPVLVIVRIIPVPVVIVAGIPESRTIGVPIPLTQICILVLARVVAGIVITLAAPSTSGLGITLRVPLPEKTQCC